MSWKQVRCRRSDELRTSPMEFNGVHCVVSEVIECTQCDCMAYFGSSRFAMAFPSRNSKYLKFFTAYLHSIDSTRCAASNVRNTGHCCTLSKLNNKIDRRVHVFCASLFRASPLVSSNSQRLLLLSFQLTRQHQIGHAKQVNLQSSGVNTTEKVSTIHCLLEEKILL